MWNWAGVWSADDVFLSSQNVLLKYRDQDDYCVACKEVDIDTKTATTTQGAERLLHAIMLLLFF